MPPRRSPRRRSNRPRRFLLALTCLVIGAAAGLLSTGAAARLAHYLPELSKSESKTEATAKTSRPALDREIDRLNHLVLEKDRQIADLTVRLKLLSEGSRTSR